MNQDEININKLKSEVLSIIEYANDEDSYMPDRIKEVKQEHNKYTKIKKEFGYSALPVNMSQISELDNTVQTFINSNNNLINKINFFCKQTEISNLDKFIQLESLLDVIKPKKGKVREKSLYMADNEINFALNKFKSTLNNMVPEHRENIEFIEKTTKKKQLTSNKQKASI